MTLPSKEVIWWGGEFVPLTVEQGANGDESNVVLITGDDAGIIFYALGGERTDAIIAEDYGLGDSDDVDSFSNPSEIPVFIDEDDGAYMIAVLLGDMAEGESRSFDWYYAAGNLDELSEVFESVEQGSTAGLGAPTDVNVAANNGQATISWTPPQGNIDFCTATAAPGDATCTGFAGVNQCTISNLAPETAYTFTVACRDENGSFGTASAAVVSATAAPTPTPIPSLSFSAMLATSGLLGLLGLFGIWRQRGQRSCLRY